MRCFFRFCFLFILLFLNSPCFQIQAQSMDELIYKEDTAFDTSCVNDFRFSIRNLNFFRNNEYKGELVKGYTLPGFWFVPTFSYQPLATLKLEAGAYLLRYWGSNIYPSMAYGQFHGIVEEEGQKGFHALPFFRVRYMPFPGFSLVLGNIYGQNNHALIEPLYNKEMMMTADPETGVQILYNSRYLNLDTWVNWERFIFQNAKIQEEFVFGISSRIKGNNPLELNASESLKNTAKVHFYLPLQLLFKHMGGEINTAAVSREVRTWLNASVGAGIDIKMPFRFFSGMNLEADWVYYAQQKGTLMPFDKGYGFYGRMTADIYKFRLYAGYWQCHDFISILGNPLFGAASTFKSGLTYKNPKTTFFGLEFSHNIGKGVALGVHADIYNTFPADLMYRSAADGHLNGFARSENSLSFMAGIYLRTNLDFLIRKF